MSTVEIKKRLIDKIQLTRDKKILEEVYRLLAIEEEDREVLKLSAEQNVVINEARNQIKSGNFLTEEQGNIEIEKWLNE
jgi:hypothetical protein